MTKPAKPDTAVVRRPAEAGAASRPVLLAGAGERAGQVRNLVRRLGLDCRVENDAKQALERIDDATRLVLVATPVSGLSAEDFCRRARKRGCDLPILIVGAPSRRAGRLYRAGASAQFDWPVERAALVRTVLRVAGGEVGPSDARDLALAARAEERIRAEREVFGPLVNVRAQRGVVFLGGEVDAAWKVSELARALSAMPGVDEVVATGVRVPPGGLTDRQIAASVRRILRSASSVDERTFGVRVAKGHVVLTGTAQSRREMHRAVELVEHVAGVRSVENLATVSRPAKQRDRRLASTLSRLVGGQFPRARVDVSVFGRTAVLAGRVRDAIQRRAIETLVSRQPGVDRVVSKVG